MRKTAGHEEIIHSDTFPSATDKYDPCGDDAKDYETLEGENRREESFDHSMENQGCEGEGGAEIDGSKLLNIFENAVTPVFEKLLDGHAEEGETIEEDVKHGPSSSVKVMKIDNPLDVFGNDDFDHGCPVIQQLEKSLGGDLPTKLQPLFDWDEISEEGDENKEGLMQLANTYNQFVKHLSKLVEAQKLSNLRMAYSYLNKTIQDPTNVEVKYKALNSLRTAQKYSNNPTEIAILSKAVDAVLKGTPEFLDAAKYRTHQVFASNVVAPNIRTAYTTLATQPGEDFLMCPKGLDMLGYPIAMEISKCRDNCIDSRVNRESGAITCGYKAWINNVADSNKKAMARLDVHRHPDNKNSLLSLKAGERGHDDPTITTEASMKKAKLNDSKVSDKTLAVQLDEFHKDGERLQDQKEKAEKKVKESDLHGVDARNTNKDSDDKSFFAGIEKNHKALTDEDVNRSLNAWLNKHREDNKKGK